MGMLGGYDAHFYCDCCKAFTEVNGIGVETYSDAIKIIRTHWKLRPDGVVLCDKCKLLPNPPLISEEQREGTIWNRRKNNSSDTDK